MIRRLILGFQLVFLPITMVVVWWIWSLNNDLPFFPPVPDILTAFEELWLFDRFGSDVIPSLWRMGFGYLVGVVSGTAIGIALGLSAFMRRAALPIIAFVRGVPGPAKVVVFLAVLGFGDWAKVTVIGASVFFPMALNTMDGVRGVEPLLKDVSRAYGLSRYERLRHVVLPSASPHIAVGLRTSLGLAFIIMVLSEFVGGSNGIGFFTNQAGFSYAIPEMWSGMLLLGILGYLANAVYLSGENRVLRWYKESQRLK